ncbi:MAG: hypothetical protein ABSC51_11855 [Gaiellaceae bacterium]|jgi:ABC-type nickel/cobalt efflux system permease component RcnA
MPIFRYVLSLLAQSPPELLIVGAIVAVAAIMAAVTILLDQVERMLSRLTRVLVAVTRLRLVWRELLRLDHPEARGVQKLRPRVRTRMNMR